MKRWTGGVLILALASVLLFRWSLVVPKPAKLPKKYSARDFFRGGSTAELGNPDREAASTGGSSPAKPRFVDREGLGELFGPRNVSAEESRSLLVWDKMRLLLSRSDSLPDTARGIREASIVLKDLAVLLDRKRFSQSENRGLSGNRDLNCPPFVSEVFEKESQGVAVLGVPCGVVEGSSISVVGIPHNGRGSFQIVLTGSRVSNEIVSPVILHYNVSLPGENVTEEPFVEQNSWTDEYGWGRAERCPGHGSMRIVDGLSPCNSQEVRSSVDANSNGSHSETAANSSASNGYGGANFPFAEGSLFTATFWHGFEGLHVTVNGRHETSFAYRETPEPWSISQVKVAGEVEVLSIMARGLPVSEDYDLVVDSEQLKAPSVPKKRLLLLIGVFSTGNNFERRMALRRSWMQYAAVRDGDVAVRFLIGLHQNIQVNAELWKEAQAYGDIQFMPFVDYYDLITYKAVATCILGTKIRPAKYIMKADDDAFVRIDELLSSLKAKPSNGLLYGLVAFESSPHREKDSKWYISEEEWPHNSYPPWAHGLGYIISRDVAKFVVTGHQKGELKLFKLEDVAMGIWVDQLKKSGQQVHYVNDDRFYNAGCENGYVLAHYQGPRKVLCLWEMLQKEHQPNCCE
ncbi:hypothetical protein MLD38_038757 [Melastoma candidum]|uniref:Uncharacterized protein n=1 Tax=Melastoma candidum TaxID=119954 RepID=A0ACB9L0N1_9MYRT|nr:hypothetical protein MLD38_038757 [Melastoma candidum]